MEGTERNLRRTEGWKVPLATQGSQRRNIQSRIRLLAFSVVKRGLDGLDFN